MRTHIVSHLDAKHLFPILATLSILQAPPSYGQSTSESIGLRSREDAPSFSADVPNRKDCSTTTASQPPRFSRATNFLYRSSEGGMLAGAFAIDPSMHIPAFLLPPLPPGREESERRNLRLVSRCGGVNVDVLLLAPGQESTNGQLPASTMASEQPAGRRAWLEVVSEYGDVSVNMNTEPDAGIYFLKVLASDGFVSVTLPRTFRGLVRLGTANGSASLGEALMGECTPLSDAASYHRWFVGGLSADSGTLLNNDASRNGDEGGKVREVRMTKGWQGNEVAVFVRNGRILVRYADEAALVLSRRPSAAANKSKGLWERIRQVVMKTRGELVFSA
ncbi:hypothetical protein CONPUDRAFT_157588 [Coniophora puteana RWD-64-598 SS2]|uniref:DUF7330 domain-containing protein n=1 Tax=Coniophora puteana (strain RWD-64-598) TaxID=741705 RepID=A0A5M3ME58_CONPW|nr:uncharacterized protein CONPUDRAFT_157588 [Coniophora puteana RWD-64-598 SS2]EIW77337.1 hypothetical protein CONPUDRAFT_157588 [Coniophora puteana RWD-64-598 SS2]